MSEPELVLVLSGKRKSGKDFIAEKVLRMLGDNECALIRLSGPLKYQYAIDNNLDYNLLMSSGSYKEEYRDDMIKWGEAKRAMNPNYFCDLACASGHGKRVWVVTDARRPSDIDYFRRIETDVRLIRVEASIEVRRSRGWTFVEGVDDCDSECALDNGVSWDHVIVNDGGLIDDALLKLLHEYRVL